jgi:hypothetical protein
MWFFSSKPKVAPPRECILMVKLVNHDVPEKKVLKAFKKVMPYLTEPELKRVFEEFRDEGRFMFRSTYKEELQFNKTKVFKSSVFQKLIPPEKYRCCRGNICGVNCAREVTATEWWSSTNPGIIPDSDHNPGDNDDDDDDD